jgi:NADP-dependent 3-hydroxy acid dehydrogenase YdfG
MRKQAEAKTRQELLEDHVRVTVIEPGVVETELQCHMTDEEARDNLDVMRKRLDALQAEDIAEPSPTR